MNITRSKLSGVISMTPVQHKDARGRFCEIYNSHRIMDIGIDCKFVQDNLSVSTKKGTVRGLHFQVSPHVQDKLVRVSRGSILDALVDIRHGSPTYAQYETFVLDAKSGIQLFVPQGLRKRY